MLYAVRYLAIAAALTAPVASNAQTQIAPNTSLADLIVDVGYNDLDSKDQRRLDFYAEKIVIEIAAIVAANDDGDVPAVRQHEEALRSMAERLLAAAGKSGLSEAETDEIFRRELIAGFSGALPHFMVTETGLAGVQDLMSLQVSEVEETNGDYVNSIRDAGATLFQN